MTLFKTFFGTAAIVAAFSFSSLDVSAQQVGQFVDLTDYEDEYVASVINVNINEPYVYDRDFFEMLVMFMNSTTPYNMGSGIEITSVTLDGNAININTTFDESITKYLSCFDEEQIEQLRETMTNSVCEFFLIYGEDDEGDTIIEKMKELGITLNYNIFIEGDETPAKTISLIVQHIHQMEPNANTALIER